VKIGVDSSVIVAAVHANHPLCKLSAGWLNDAFQNGTVVVAHHSLLESYAVLTRLPPDFRLTPAEAERVLRETLEPNTTLAPFAGNHMWPVLARLAEIPAAGGSSYDAFIIHILKEAGVDAIASFNAEEFRRLSPGTQIIDPGA